jgi:hypothetical protein
MHNLDKKGGETMFRKLFVTTAGAAFLLTAPSCSAEDSAAAQQSTKGQKPAAAAEAGKAQPTVPADRGRMIEEAVSAIQETQNALMAIDRNQRQQALDALARATGKLEILLAREPSLALAPVDVSVVTRDVVGDERALEALRKRAEEALERGRLQEARRLISDLASETVVSVSNLPLATYPAAIKTAAAQLDRGQTEAAKATLQTALNTLVVQETIFPLPLQRAQVALNEAKRLAEKANRTEADNRRLALLLANARREIRFGQSLGYGIEDDMRQLLAEVDQIESRTSGQKHGRGFFDRIDGLFDKARQSSQSPRNNG